MIAIFIISLLVDFILFQFRMLKLLQKSYIFDVWSVQSLDHSYKYEFICGPIGRVVSLFTVTKSDICRMIYEECNCMRVDLNDSNL